MSELSDELHLKKIVIIKRSEAKIFMVNANWFLITFTSEEIQQGKEKSFVIDFTSLKESVPSELRLALFSRNNPKDSSRTYYFPNIGDDFYRNLIKNYPSINRSQKPSKWGLAIPIGSLEDRDDLFNE